MIGVGDEVQCINDSEPDQIGAPYVVKGRNYTVTAVEIKPWPVQTIPVMDGAVVIVYAPVEFVWVAGLPSKTGHFAFRFRKVEKQSKTTDISVFRKILDKVPENVQ